jgi:Bacterial virulence factor lipase N-terminal
MFETRNRVIAPALLAAVTALALGGCSASQEGDPLPPPPSDVAKANFDIATGKVPYPIDLFFAPSADNLVSDGTINLPSIAYRPASMRAALNSLDGWSTSASLDTSFSLPLDSSSISASSVKIVKLWLNPSTKAPVNPADPLQAGYLPVGATSPVAGVLAFGTDFTADISDDIDSGGKVLRITPLKPWEASRGPAVNSSGDNAGRLFNVGYLVILTNGLKAAGGASMAADTLYSDIKAAPADCSTFTNATQKAVCQLTKAHLGIAQATGTDPASIVLSWGFSTQATTDTLNVVTSIAAQTHAALPNRTLVVPAFSTALGRVLTTKDANSGLQGKANIYVGSTVLPYYLTPAANATDRTSVLTKFWTAAGPPPAPLTDTASRNLTMFNPIPAKVSDVTVPILVTVPNATSACPAPPAGGWKIAIVQHGITGNRSQALAMADAFADNCFVVASMDLPLHGIVNTGATDPLTGFHCFAPPAAANPACLGAVERTFDVDLLNNSNGFAASDGVIDSSGAHFINLASPLTGRDNLRQAEADLIFFAKSVKTLQIPPGTPFPAGPLPVDGNHVSFVGLSLGSIVGGTAAKFVPTDIKSAALSVPGGVITKLLNDSATFGPIISGGVNGQGLPPGSYLYNLYFRDFQAVVDSGDPFNHIKDTQARVPTHVFKVLNDSVVPNSATDRLITAGGLTKLKTLGPNPVARGAGTYSFFKVGSHGTLFDPTASLPATMEMQAQAISFSASALTTGGPFLVMGLADASVLDLQ